MSLLAFAVTKSPVLHALVPIARIICAVVFFLGGLSEFRRTDGGFQPLDFSEADKSIRRIVAALEIICSILLFAPQAASIAAGALFFLCLGAILLDPPIFRRSPMLPVLIVLLLFTAVQMRDGLEYWRTHHFDLSSYIEDQLR